MEFTLEELQEAKRQIGSTIHKLQEALQSLEGKEEPRRYQSQITLARRRIRAFSIACSLIDEKMQEKEI